MVGGESQTRQASMNRREAGFPSTVGSVGHNSIGILRQASLCHDQPAANDIRMYHGWS
jgi:hypothetical protein